VHNQRIIKIYSQSINGGVRGILDFIPSPFVRGRHQNPFNRPNPLPRSVVPRNGILKYTGAISGSVRVRFDGFPTRNHPRFVGCRGLKPGSGEILDIKKPASPRPFLLGGNFRQSLNRGHGQLSGRDHRAQTRRIFPWSQFQQLTHFANNLSNERAGGAIGFAAESGGPYGRLVQFLASTNGHGFRYHRPESIL